MSKIKSANILKSGKNKAKKKNDDEMFKSEDLYRYVFDFSPVGKSITLISGEINVNQAFCEMLGYSMEELQHKKWQEITHPDDIELTQKEIDSLISGKQDSARFVKRFIHKNGSTLWGDLHSALRRDEDGKPLYLMSTLIDINEKKKAEDILRESERRLQNTFDQSPVGSVIVGLDKRFIKCNAAFCSFLDYSEDELIGKTIADVTFPEDRELGMADIKLMVEGKLETSTVQKRYLRKDGKIVWGDVKISMVRDSENNPIYFLPVIQDITEGKLVEEKLKESETLFRKMNENSPLGMHFYKLNNDNQLIFVGANPAANKLLGVDHSQFFGKTIEEAFPPLIQTEVPERYRNAAAKGIPWATEEIAYDDNKIRGAFEVKAFQTKPGNMVAVFADITERKRAEIELKQASENWNKTFDAIQDGIILLNANQQIIQSNRAYNEFVGLTPGELYSCHCFQQVHNTDCPIEGCPFVKMRTSKKRENMEMIINESAYNIMVDPILDAEENIIGAVHIISDITQRKREEKELIEAKERAEESDRLKSSFLANMSHEIRTPMNSIMGFASLMPEEENKELMYNYANIIIRSSEQLLHIINDIVLYSRLQTRLLSFQPTPFNIQNLLADVKQFFSLPDYQKGVELNIETDSEIPVWIRSDYEKVRQIFTNLVSNAFKYTCSGSITFGFKSKEDEMELFVRDTGMGIPPEELEKVFDRFYRGSNVNKGVISGTGLGLSIVKELSELLGGRIWVESEIYKGSTFFFTLPTNKNQ